MAFIFAALMLLSAHGVHGSAMPPHTQFRERPVFSNKESYDPCNPSPCGRNTVCMSNPNGVAVCKCIEGFFPKPDTITGCGPQCERDDECPTSYACARNKCVNPCQLDGGGTLCGVDAYCRVENHRAICTCPTGYNGNPNVKCFINTIDESRTSASSGSLSGRNPIVHSGTGGGSRFDIVQQSQSFRFPSSSNSIRPSQRQGVDNLDPCNPSPCGSNTNCRVQGNRAVCSCQYGYYGNPETNCIKGDCIDSNDCPDTRVCREFRCEDPCIGTCGTGAECVARRHIPICQCPAGFSGDPFTRCSRITEEELCNPSPCGQNTQCTARNFRAVCSCKPGYFGDPLVGCRAECEADFDCGLREICRNLKCVNPCVDACGENAECDVINRIATCRCPQDYLGNPQVRCYPECTKHEECPRHMACSKFKCTDPCLGTCGIQAQCRVDDHVAICSCPKGYTGDPFQRCRPFTPDDFCVPTPCGSGAECKPGTDNEGNQRAVCSCPSGYIGDPLISCRRGECISHSECPNHKACFNYRCEDPCAQGACGVNADCTARNHAAVCSCPPNFTGDPLTSCQRRDQRKF